MHKRIKQSFEKQGIMQTLNAQLAEVEKGQIKITCEFSKGLNTATRLHSRRSCYNTCG